MPRPATLVLTLLAIAAVYYALAWSLQRAILFPRYLPRYAKQAAPPPGVEVLYVASPAGPVEAWFFPAPGARAASPAPAVICAHGNAEVIDRWVEEARRLQGLGLHVLLAEYRGYGRSAGAPSRAAIGADFVRFHDALVARPEVDPARLVYFGRSLGVAAVLELAVARPPRALILQSGFSSVADMARGYLLPRALVRDPFDNLSALRQTTAPVLILHGERDTIVPPEHARELAAAAGPRAQLVLMDCDHNDCPPAETLDAFWAGIGSFLREAGVLSP
ncbi:MAG: alpha/beta hydrolase [Acidobacteria bacterium]|nr:alpha/beta hydrolase [Acidobacteriota bacterium]